jgi:two-component system CheB/CheR fusion protein
MLEKRFYRADADRPSVAVGIKDAPPISQPGETPPRSDDDPATAADLRDVLYSLNLATLQLDRDLNIRFFTPEIRSIFSLRSGDIGRPLADFRALGSDDGLFSDVAVVLQTSEPTERETEGKDGVRYIRRISPYRTETGMAGVVLTFRNLTERMNIVRSLEAAVQQAEQETAAKSRFLSTASHDLRQPLQTLAMLHGMLAEGNSPKDLAQQLDQALGTMSGMLSTLLDLNQFEVERARPDITRVSIDWLFGRLKDEFTYRAHAEGLSLHIVPCRLSVDSDPGLLKQMIRILLMNAIAYTTTGKLLLGCRRRKGVLSIEVWDTGAGLSETALGLIFTAQQDLDRRKPNLGGHGLAIFKTLADLLGHRVFVRSVLGKGSVFSIDIELPLSEHRSAEASRPGEPKPVATSHANRARSILIVDDSQEQREIFAQVLTNEGHEATTASDAESALALVAHGAIRPDIVITDYRLPSGMNGLELGIALRERLHHEVPLIVLSADILASTPGNRALQHCEQLRKPVKLKELRQAIQRLLPDAQAAEHPAGVVDATQNAVISIVDDDRHIRAAIRSVLEGEGMIVEEFESSEAFLAAYRPEQEGCLLIDAYLPGMSGLELLDRLTETGHALAAIMITGHGDVPMATQAMKAGASDFLEKPVGRSDLLASIDTALSESRDNGILSARREAAVDHVACLTPRQRQVMELVLAGHPSKNIAADLGLSQRTVENHRASVMRKTGSKSLPALARLVVAATAQSSTNGAVRGVSRSDPG